MIAPASGALTFDTAPDHDHESPADVLSTTPSNRAENNQYVLVVTAAGGTGDRAMTAAQTVTVNVDEAGDGVPGRGWGGLHESRGARRRFRP